VQQGTRRTSGQLRPRTTDAAYEKYRLEYAAALQQAVAEAQRGIVSAKALDALAPPGVPPMTNDEVQRMLALHAVDRDLVVGMLASAVALARTVRDAGDVRAALDAARSVASEPALAKQLEQESKRLDDEVRRLREEFEITELVSRARLRADAVAAERLADRVRESTAPWRDADRQNAAREATREWSKSCPPLRK
jgi:hypothetical protein